MRKSNAVLEKPAGKVACQHHWLIEPANGLTSFGICKNCGERKQFLNVIQDVVPDQAKEKKSSAGISLYELMEAADVVDDEDDVDDDED